MGNSGSRRLRSASLRENNSHEPTPTVAGLISHSFRHHDPLSLDDKAVNKLIHDKKLAPKIKGTDEERPDAEECPICFLFHDHLNRVNCCKQSICTVCFLEVKKLQGCPFCANVTFSVSYSVPIKKPDSIRESPAEIILPPPTNNESKSIITNIESIENKNINIQKTSSPESSAPIPITSESGPESTTASISAPCTPPQSMSPSSNCSSSFGNSSNKTILESSVEARKALEKEIMIQRTSATGYFSYPSPKHNDEYETRAMRGYNRSFMLRYNRNSPDSIDINNSNSNSNGGNRSGSHSISSIREAFRRRQNRYDNNNTLDFSPEHNHSDNNNNNNNTDNTNNNSDLYALGIDMQQYRRRPDRDRDRDRDNIGHRLHDYGGIAMDRNINDLAQIEEIMLSEAIRLSMAESQSQSNNNSNNTNSEIKNINKQQQNNNTSNDNEVAVKAPAIAVSSPSSVSSSSIIPSEDLSPPQSYAISVKDSLSMDGRSSSRSSTDSNSPRTGGSGNGNGDRKLMQMISNDDEEEDKDLLLAIALSLQEQENSEKKTTTTTTAQEQSQSQNQYRSHSHSQSSARAQSTTQQDNMKYTRRTLDFNERKDRHQQKQQYDEDDTDTDTDGNTKEMTKERGIGAKATSTSTMSSMSSAIMSDRPPSPPMILLPPDFIFKDADEEEEYFRSWSNHTLADNNGQESVYTIQRTVDGQRVVTATPPAATSSSVNSRRTSLSLMDKIDMILRTPPPHPGSQLQKISCSSTAISSSTSTRNNSSNDIKMSHDQNDYAKNVKSVHITKCKTNDNSSDVEVEVDDTSLMTTLFKSTGTDADNSTTVVESKASSISTSSEKDIGLKSAARFDSYDQKALRKLEYRDTTNCDILPARERNTNHEYSAFVVISKVPRAADSLARETLAAAESTNNSKNTKTLSKNPRPGHPALQKRVYLLEIFEINLVHSSCNNLF
eukprot:gene2859-5621_t